MKSDIDSLSIMTEKCSIARVEEITGISFPYHPNLEPQSPIILENFWEHADVHTNRSTQMEDSDEAVSIVSVH